MSTLSVSRNSVVTYETISSELRKVCPLWIVSLNRRVINFSTLRFVSYLSVGFLIVVVRLTVEMSRDLCVIVSTMSTWCLQFRSVVPDLDIRNGSFRIYHLFPRLNILNLGVFSTSATTSMVNSILLHPPLWDRTGVTEFRKRLQRVTGLGRPLVHWILSSFVSDWFRRVSLYLGCSSLTLFLNSFIGRTYGAILKGIGDRRTRVENSIILVL